MAYIGSASVTPYRRDGKLAGFRMEFFDIKNRTIGIRTFLGMDDLIVGKTAGKLFAEFSGQSGKIERFQDYDACSYTKKGNTYAYNFYSVGV